ncbi:MAG: methionyl-tRNA formyltransferase [Acidobacteria bacterium]|nr:MAG: methionyl-tRNA formyltransferase [Acidobacteriota bacterium]
MNLIFCGTPQFAVPSLEKLVAENFSIQLVMTNPDEPRGRGHKVQPSPVKETALKHALPLYQPAKVKTGEAREYLSHYRVDVIVIVAYGHIVPQWMIDLPPLGCINLHASILPKYRGAAPIAWAIIRGEKETGVTTMKIDAGMDTGDVLLERREPIRADDTTETLSERLSIIGADLMVETLHRLEQGEITPRPQDHHQATFAPRLQKDDGLIDWSLPALDLERRVRGLIPWPGAYTLFRGKRLHVWRAEVAQAPGAAAVAPGTISAEVGRLSAACGDGKQLVLHDVQLEGRKRLSARDFINGARALTGEILGF